MLLLPLLSGSCCRNELHNFWTKPSWSLANQADHYDLLLSCKPSILTMYNSTCRDPESLVIGDLIQFQSGLRNYWGGLPTAFLGPTLRTYDNTSLPSLTVITHVHRVIIHVSTNDTRLRNCIKMTEIFAETVESLKYILSVPIPTKDVNGSAAFLIWTVGLRVSVLQVLFATFHYF